MAWKMDLEAEVELLCNLKVKKFHENIEQRKNYFKKEENRSSQSGYGPHKDKINKRTNS